jgi:hypothetical protein
MHYHYWSQKTTGVSEFAPAGPRREGLFFYAPYTMKRLRHYQQKPLLQASDFDVFGSGSFTM